MFGAGVGVPPLPVPAQGQRDHSEGMGVVRRSPKRREVETWVGSEPEGRLGIEAQLWEMNGVGYFSTTPDVTVKESS